MSRAKLPTAWCVALAWGGLAFAQAQPPAPPTAPVVPAAAAAQPKAAPSLEDRVGKTVNVAEANKAAEKAVILQVWRLADGSGCMQAHSLATGEPLTIVESANPKADNRFTIYRWTTAGVAPAGCPLPPSTAKVASAAPIVQAGAQASAAPAPVAAAMKQGAPVQQAVAAQPAASAQPAAKPAAKVAGSLFPPSYGQKEEAKVEATQMKPMAPVVPASMLAMPVAAAPIPLNKDGSAMTIESTQPAIKAEMPKAVVQTETAPKLIAKPATLTTTKIETPAPAVAKVAAAAPAVASPYAAGAKPVAAAKADGVKQASGTAETAAPAAAAPVKVSTLGKHTMKVTENGVEREVVVTGEHRVAGQPAGWKVQAVDNGECFTISNCQPVCPTPCPAPCAAPCPTPCPPVVVAQPCPTPCPTPCPAPCPPAVVAKPCEPCQTASPCEPCGDACAPRKGLLSGLFKSCNMDRPAACDTCGDCKTVTKDCTTCGDSCTSGKGFFSGLCKQGCDERPAKPGLLDRPSDCNACVRPNLFDKGCGEGCGDKDWLPVPMPHMGQKGFHPGCNPAAPCIPAYNTMESPAMKAFYNEPRYGVSSSWRLQQACVQMHAKICQGVEAVYTPEEAEAVKNTVYLMAVLQHSQHPQNRAWAAERLAQVRDAQLQPFAVDALVACCMTEPVPQVRVAALSTLGNLGADTPAVRQMLARCGREADPLVRNQAAAVAGQLSAQKMTPTASQPASPVKQADFAPSKQAMDR